MTFKIEYQVPKIVTGYGKKLSFSYLYNNCTYILPYFLLIFNSITLVVEEYVDEGDKKCAYMVKEKQRKIGGIRNLFSKATGM